MKPQIITTGDHPIGYKVLKKDGSFLTSPFSPFPIKYHPLKWARPKKYCGPLAVWASKEDIPKLKADEEIWECEYVQCFRSKDIWHRDDIGQIPAIGDVQENSVLAWKVRLLRREIPSQ